MKRIQLIYRCALLIALLLLAVPANAAPDADKFYKDGFRMFMENKYHNAAVQFAKAIAVNPRIAKYHFFLGRTFEHLNSSAKAVEEYRMAIKIDPQHANAMRRIGSLFLREGAYVQAINELKPILKFSPKDFGANQKIGESFFFLGQYDDAIKRLMIAEKSQPQNPFPPYYIGRAYLEQGLWAQAVNSMKKAIEEDGSNAEFFFWLGSAYYAQGDFRNDKDEYWLSGRNFRRAIEIGYTNPTSLFMLGNTLLHRGIYLKANNRDREAGEVLKSAVSQYREVIRKKSDAANAYLNLGLSFYAMRKLDESLSSIRRAINYEPTVDFFHDFRGNTLFMLGRFDEAIDAWTLVKELNPKYEPQTSKIFGFESNTIEQKILEARRKR